MRSAIAIGLFLWCSSFTAGQEPAVADVLRRFEAAKPSDKSLAFYSLDWVCSLQEAKARAKAENRAVLLILNTNITAHCNFYSGHT